MASPVGNTFHAQRCGRLATPRKTGTKKGAASVQPLSSLGQAEHHSNHCPLELKPVALSPRFLFFLDLLSPASAAAPLEQHPAEEDLVPEAPLVSAEAEAPLEQQLADLDLSQEAFWSLEQVCSVLALLSEGASVDWADAVNAKNAKAPRKRNLFIVLLSFIDRRKHLRRCSVAKIQTPSVCDAGRERISLFLPSRNSQVGETTRTILGEVAEW